MEFLMMLLFCVLIALLFIVGVVIFFIYVNVYLLVLFAVLVWACIKVARKL